MKRAPGTGGIRKLKGKRRRPYQAIITTGKEWRNGKVVRVQKSIGCFATRREAQFALDEFIRHNINLDYRNITFAEIFEIIKDDFTPSMKHPMQAAFRKCLYLHDKRIIDIRKMDLDIVANNAAGLSKSSQTNISIVIKQVFRWAMENDVIIKDYSGMLSFKDTATSQRRQAYTEAEIKTVLSSGTDVHKILLYSGMRINELINMKSADVYEESGILCFHVTNSKTAAGLRTIPVHSSIMDLINTDGTYLLEPHHQYNYYLKKLHEWNRKHRMNRNYHELRHTFATYAKSCGMDEYARRILLGHAQKDITDSVYTHPQTENLKNQIELLRYPV